MSGATASVQQYLRSKLKFSNKKKVVHKVDLSILAKERSDQDFFKKK